MLQTTNQIILNDLSEKKGPCGPCDHHHHDRTSRTALLLLSTTASLGLYGTASLTAKSRYGAAKFEPRICKKPKQQLKWSPRARGQPWVSHGQPDQLQGFYSSGDKWLATCNVVL